jgi:hypothetical protein
LFDLSLLLLSRKDSKSSVWVLLRSYGYRFLSMLYGVGKPSKRQQWIGMEVGIYFGINS